MSESRRYRFFILSLVFIAVAIAGTSLAQVPAPPSQVADRVGVYA